MEGGGVDFPAAEQLAHAVAHFVGGIDGVGERENLVRLGVALADQAFDAVGQDRSLAGAGAGDHQHGSVDMFDGFALAIVWSERNWDGS